MRRVKVAIFKKASLLKQSPARTKTAGTKPLRYAAKTLCPLWRLFASSA
jgi:hypothetical protein